MPSPAPTTPSKIIAVHLNYRSRAAQRGTTPAVPSYFMKPPNTIAGDGELVRPRGTELLGYEGEVAVIIGRRARRVSPQDALAHIGWYAAANDAGVADFRWNDRGANLFSKGQDGFTPMGPTVDAGDVDPGGIVLRTRVNGEVVQEDSTANLIFSFADLIADITRFVTLEPGDVILTGTPANSRPVEIGDLVEVEVEGIGRLANRVIELDHDLPDVGAAPEVGAQTLHVALAMPEDEAERRVASGDLP
jgi:5-oxopent-3-ene-1,2,5-tricarboxylate decarboxylase/2-hydroxyhepta-2,4-diene-1,7-dioate isomerase